MFERRQEWVKKVGVINLGEKKRNLKRKRNNMINHWYIVAFEQETINSIKQDRCEKDKHQWGNRFDSDTRWVGDLGELAFKDWLNEIGFPYNYWTNKQFKDTRDFTVGRLEIDVKTIATNYFPKRSYSCQVAASQLKNEAVNTYVFSRYLLDKKKR